ncbi:MAG: hypothetical protein OEL77_00445 [Nitrosopumilus sp.]|nr:hypothetical protein [Nitrosopumilus sp.]MDH3384471.1 hypothetical protein [Nitrosopumilus sp.]
MKIDRHLQFKEDFKTPLTNEGLKIICERLCGEPKIRFCGIINPLGRIVSGGFKNGIQPIDNEGLRRMLYIQSSLELSMKEEFDNALGNVNYISTYRDNVIIIIVPMIKNLHLLMSVERNANIEKIIKKVTSLFNCNGLVEKIREGTTNKSNTHFPACS